jgi:hypothetical protein
MDSLSAVTPIFHKKISVLAAIKLQKCNLQTGDRQRYKRRLQSRFSRLSNYGLPLA